MASTTIKVKIDVKPLLSFIQLFTLGLHNLVAPVKIGKAPYDLFRIEQNRLTARTKEILVRVYPSDAFLRYASAVFAGNLNLGAIENSGHVTSAQKRNNKC